MENFILLIALFLSHYIVDYTPIGNTIEIQDKQYHTLMIHSSIHTIMLWIILFIYSSFVFELDSLLIFYSLIIQFSSHFIVDAWVGLMNKYYPKSETKTMQSFILGVDQFLHSVALIVIYFNLN